MDETELYRPRRAIPERHERRDGGGDAFRHPATGGDEAPRPAVSLLRLASTISWEVLFALQIQSVQLAYLDRGSFNISRRTGLNPRRSGLTLRLEEPTRYTARYTVFQ
jgi:hypothetical protein